MQGGLDPELRLDCARRLGELDFPGYAVGGLSVGEDPADMLRILDVTVPALPAGKPRYLMGVGRPQDLLEAIRRGIDLFDCVLPTRTAGPLWPIRPPAWSGCGTCNIGSIGHRSRPAAPARLAGTAEVICDICFWPAKCWDRSWSRSTT